MLSPLGNAVAQLSTFAVPPISKDSGRRAMDKISYHNKSHTKQQATCAAGRVSRKEYNETDRYVHYDKRKDEVGSCSGYLVPELVAKFVREYGLQHVAERERNLYRCAEARTIAFPNQLHHCKQQNQPRSH